MSVPLIVMRALLRYWPVASFCTRPEIEPVEASDRAAEVCAEANGVRTDSESAETRILVRSTRVKTIEGQRRSFIVIRSAPNGDAVEVGSGFRQAKADAPAMDFPRRNRVVAISVPDPRMLLGEFHDHIQIT